MKKVLTILVFIAGAAVAAAHSQDIRDLSPDEQQKVIDRRTQERIRQTAADRQEVLVKNDPTRINNRERRILLDRWRYKTLPRGLTKENLKYLEPPFADFKKYERLLAQPGTGLIRLLPDIGCRKQMVIDASSPCVMNASIPGDGAAFSFRKNTYVEVELSDLLFKDGKFQAEGVLTQGVLVKLGAVPVEDVSLASKGMKFLTDFAPAARSRGAEAQKAELRRGVRSDGFVYAAAQPLEENATYALRSVAYRGTGWFDERRDVIVVFQIVRAEEKGSVVIVWKQLRNIESPKMKK